MESDCSHVKMQKAVLQLSYQFMRHDELRKKTLHAKMMDKSNLEIDVLQMKKIKLQRELGIEDAQQVE